MFDTLKRILTNTTGTPSDPAQNWDLRADAIDIAVCVVLLEVAHADDDFEESAREQILRFFEERARLSPQAAEELMLLSEKVREGSVELWQFTRLISEHFSVEEKLALAETMWKIIYSDGRLSTQEDYIVHKLSTLFGLRHSELIETKIKVLREQGLEKNGV